MAFSISTKGLPCFRTYQQALRHYENIKPIRGSDLRPIGPRRKTHMKILQLFNGDIACRLYSTDCVVYHQDDSITVNFGGWNTISTAAFIHAISPYSANQNGYVCTSKGYFKVPISGLKILPDGTPVNPVQEYRTLLDKKKAAETRKRLKPFLNWAEACLKLGGEFNDPDYLPAGALLNSDSQGIYPKVASTYFSRWGSGARRLFSDAYKTGGCFIKTPVPLGEIKRPTQWD